MNKIHQGAVVLAAVGMFAGLPLLSGVALAGHIHTAVDQAKEAVAHGKEEHGAVCGEHAQLALNHAKESKLKSPHMDEGIKHLMEAAKHGKAGHADACTEHANKAIMHLSEVKEK